METGMELSVRRGKLQWQRASGGWPDLDRFAALAGAIALCAWVASAWMASATLDERAAATQGSVKGEETGERPQQGTEYIAAGYVGAPYTHPSDVKFSKPGVTDLTAHGVRWEGKPFKSPIYYGIRTMAWGRAGTLGAMLDFTHSKAISQRGQEVKFSGKRNGQPMPGSATIGDTFRHFEFSHGHNMLTANGLVRLASIVPGLAPYLGAGVGVALPHTEIQFAGDSGRTYEYQYVGPAAQALIGLELKLPRISLFVEYKFSIARYHAPLTNRDGGWFPEDFWHQLVTAWRGEIPSDGYLSTTLASHQVVSGAGYRWSLGTTPAK